MLEQQQYHLIREHMQPGDIIAFGGNSLFSRWTPPSGADNNLIF